MLGVGIPIFLVRGDVSIAGDLSACLVALLSPSRFSTTSSGPLHRGIHGRLGKVTEAATRPLILRIRTELAPPWASVERWARVSLYRVNCRVSTARVRRRITCDRPVRVRIIAMQAGKGELAVAGSTMRLAYRQTRSHNVRLGPLHATSPVGRRGQPPDRRTRQTVTPKRAQRTKQKSDDDGVTFVRPASLDTRTLTRRFQGHPVLVTVGDYGITDGSEVDPVRMQ